MKDNIDFKHYWKKQNLESPDISEITNKAKTYKKKALIRLILANIALILTSAFVGFIWYYFQPEYLTTKIGIIVCILDMVIYLFFHNTLIPLLIKRDYSLNVKQQLNQLKDIKAKQFFHQTTLLSVYFGILYIGLSLYLYEYASKMSTFWAIFTYATVLVWIGINAFYFRPRIVRKQQKKLNTLIHKLNQIEKQLYEK